MLSVYWICYYNFVYYLFYIVRVKVFEFYEMWNILWECMIYNDRIKIFFCFEKFFSINKLINYMYGDWKRVYLICFFEIYVNFVWLYIMCWKV